MKINIRKINWCTFVTICFLLSNVSAFLGSLLNRTIFPYTNYLLMFLTIVVIFIYFLKSGYLHNAEKSVLFLFAYIFLYVVQYQLLDTSNTGLFGISAYIILLFQVITVFMISQYLSHANQTSEYRAIVFSFIFIIIVDVVHSFAVLSINNEALRISTWQNGKSYLESMGLYGVCNVNHIYAFVCAVPILDYLLENVKKPVVKVLFFVFTLMTVLLVLRSGYTSSLLILLAYLFYKLFMRRNKIASYFALVIAAAIFLVVAKEIGLFRILADTISNESVKERFILIDSFLRGSSISGDLLIRVGGYSKGIEGFLKSPLLGNAIFGNRIISGHSFLIDLLSDWGLLGFSLYITFLHQTFKRLSRCFLYHSSNAFKESYYLLLIGLLINPLGHYVQIYASVFIFGVATLKYIDLYTSTTSEPSSNK